MYQDLNDAQIDALKEMGNVGAGQAATALSKMVDKKVDMNIPKTKFVRIEKFCDEFQTADQQVIGIYLKTQGELIGETLFLFPLQGGKELIDIVLGQKAGTTKIVSEMEESVLKEVSNIFTGAYMTSLADMLDIRLFPGVPHIATDMAQAVVDGILANIAMAADEVLFVDSEINIEGHAINGKFMFFFDIASLKTIVRVLNEKFGIETD